MKRLQSNTKWAFIGKAKRLHWVVLQNQRQ